MALSTPSGGQKSLEHGRNFTIPVQQDYCCSSYKTYTLYQIGFCSPPPLPQINFDVWGAFSMHIINIERGRGGGDFVRVEKKERKNVSEGFYPPL